MRLQHMYLVLGVVSLVTIPTQSFNIPGLQSLFDGLSRKIRGEDPGWQDEISVPEGLRSRHGRRNKRDVADENTNDAHLAESSELPMMPNDKSKINHRYLPTLANGHIAFTPYDDGVYMNGLFSGAGGASQRAKIPALIVSRLNLSSPEQERQAVRKYKFDAMTGIFTETINAEFAVIEHRFYVHQKYTKLLVCDIHAKKKDNSPPGGGSVHFYYYPTENHTDDIQFQPKEHYNSNWRTQGRTREAEISGAQLETAHVFWLHPFVDMQVQKPENNQTLIMAVARTYAEAQYEFDRALEILFDDQDGGAHRLMTEHIEAWQNIWSRGRLEIEGDTYTAKVAHFAQYYILSNMPALDPYSSRPRTEYLWGPGRGSLGRGTAGKDKRGHVFWDNEVYILPTLILLHPDLAKFMLRYRSAQQSQASEEAEKYGDQGYRFPWESAKTGRDVTPEGTCDGCRDRQIHTGAGVAWGVRQFFSATRDWDYITNVDFNTCDMTREIAKFYAERAIFSNEDGRYHINDIMGPDDYHDNVNNDAYTNAAASLAIHWGRYMACMCGRDEKTEVPDEYIQKALLLKLPFDNVRRVHDQYDGYSQGSNGTVKQADVIMLGYPLNWNMSSDIQEKDLRAYELLHDNRGPAMTNSFMTVGWKFVNDDSNMRAYYTKSYQDFLVQPFKVWTEYIEYSQEDMDEGTVNFLPGMGAFLQSIIYGFIGIRIRPEMIEFHNPMPPPDSSVARLIGFNYLTSNMTITVYRSPRRVEIEVISVSDEFPLVLVRNNSNGPGVEESVNPGETITIENAQQGFYMYTNMSNACDHPRDYIYMPWGYSPWIDGATSTRPSPLLLLALLLLCTVWTRLRSTMH